LNNQPAFCGFFISKAWGHKGGGYINRYFHLPIQLSPNAILFGGRSHGKSASVLEPRMIMCLFKFCDEELVLSSFRRLHIKDRMESVIRIINAIPYFTALINRTRRDPHYEITTCTGMTLYGISVGDDPTAISIQGKHPIAKFGEEWQVYGLSAWKQWQSTVSPRGCEELYCGCVDGRVDTPFRQLDTHTDDPTDKFRHRRFHVPRYLDPWWNEQTKRDCILNLGGEHSDDYLQQVMANWGSPSSSVWDTMAIYGCMSKEVSCPLLEYTNETWMSFSEMSLPEIPKGTSKVAAGMDVGFTEPSEIGVFAKIGDRWRLFVRIHLRNKIIYDQQAEIVDRIMGFYRIEFLGIDITNSPSISTTLKNEEGKYAHKFYGDKIIDIHFNEVISYEVNGDEKKQKAKLFATDSLRAMFRRRMFELPMDEEIISLFNTEKQKIGDTFTSIKTPTYVHLPEMFRCFAIAYFRRYSEDFIEGSNNYHLMLPVVGHTGLFRSSSSPQGTIYDKIPVRRIIR